MPKKKPAEQPDPDVEAQANEETNEETSEETQGQEPEMVRQRPERPFCEGCGTQMTAAGSRPTKTHYKCPKCGITKSVPRPSPVPVTPPNCPYVENHGGQKVQCKRHVENGIVIDRCREPGCGFRADYGPTMPQLQQEGFSAR